MAANQTPSLLVLVHRAQKAFSRSLADRSSDFHSEAVGTALSDLEEAAEAAAKLRDENASLASERDDLLRQRKVLTETLGGRQQEIARLVQEMRVVAAGLGGAARGYTDAADLRMLDTPLAVCESATETCKKAQKEILALLPPLTKAGG